jgi:lysophospholipase L1-like esterase
MRRFRDRGVEIGRARGAEVFDFSQVAEKHPRRQALYIETGVHLSVEGADLFAARLAEFIAARR